MILIWTLPFGPLAELVSTRTAEGWIEAWLHPVVGRLRRAKILTFCRCSTFSMAACHPGRCCHCDLQPLYRRHSHQSCLYILHVNSVVQAYPDNLRFVWAASLTTHAERLLALPGHHRLALRVD